MMPSGGVNNYILQTTIMPQKQEHILHLRSYAYKYQFEEWKHVDIWK